MKAPFPYFGGKSKVSDVIWKAFGLDSLTELGLWINDIDVMSLICYDYYITCEVHIGTIKYS
jgi:hypothetical protein